MVHLQHGVTLQILITILLFLDLTHGEQDEPLSKGVEDRMNRRPLLNKQE